MAQSFSTTLPKPTSSSSPACTLLFIFTLCILTLYTLHHHHNPHPPPPQSTTNPPSVSTFISSASNYTISTYLRHLTLHPHIAGTPPSSAAAAYVTSHFQSFNIPTHVTNFSVLLSYPVSSSLTAHFSNSSTVSLTLTEPGFGSDSEVVRPYHAYSPSGTAYGKAVYVSHGREEDYRALAAAGVNVNGCIAVVKRGGGMSRNAVVVKAAERGVTAVVMFTDGNGNGVERGTVLDGVGDPLTPGWGASGGGGGDVERLRVEDSEVSGRFPVVPSLPVSAETAAVILGSLGGPRVAHIWKNGEVDQVRKFDRVGPGPTFLNFTYEGENKVGVIQNVFGVIKGSEEPDRFVVLGNHRDAWTYGAVDPNSGTAALIDIARRYSLMMRLGWNPRRTIYLCSWDAEEFGMIGSTEWVEQNLVNLGSKAVTYINVDCAVQGPGFFAAATPQLDDILVEVTKKVTDPDSSGSTLFDKWRTNNEGYPLIERLSDVFSDFSPFLHHAGVPSVDLYYGKAFPVYHTAFDSYDWIVKHGDPLFHRHVAVAGVWGLLALHLADDPILPFNYLSYAAQLQNHTQSLYKLIKGDVSLHPITSAIEELADVAKQVEDEIKKIKDEEAEGRVSDLKRRVLNDRLMFAERGFLDSDGIRGRQWFKHLVYGPASEGKLGFFPGVADAIYESKRQSVIQHEIWRVGRAIQRAASALKGELT
ncbi:putative glutamate carboxypeptidase [Helianthus annuus]|uniref:glutamate carboxypeptidase II n=1 Tax=Helianthus annuus TaxID=4232 RepID=A0A251UBS7_HELAN|nr:probable glutamate carboxypeptidase AMP1 [Helianthus annuus]KAF5799389.1 putative glutamate carboxypeptidase [Helianthus annuus]KAJ0550840.1 putative glutamate carboxypeptidase [Helianthus annuus]KAJ0557698.1 putative glutamate carboxypeptidase [Helianthus annuus]KAJ0563806.1 putative glutamate carboxypeptidase [Helianthus annuus]KAJ0731882.1 putative glutamate carboxypeptidase [Helianthus annuus]